MFRDISDDLLALLWQVHGMGVYGLKTTTCLCVHACVCACTCTGHRGQVKYVTESVGSLFLVLPVSFSHVWHQLLRGTET